MHELRRLRSICLSYDLPTNSDEVYVDDMRKDDEWSASQQLVQNHGFSEAGPSRIFLSL